ncbi:MAG: putative DNA-binding domain-containing protein, partial [Polyangiales bacterium]
LLRYTLTRIPSSYITLEWDHQLPQWQALLATLAAMQAAMQDATPAAPAAEAPAPTAPLVHAVTGQAGPVDLRSYQRQVQHLLGQQRPPAALARIWQQDEARLAFYPQASRVARRQVLDKIYPALADVLPAASWEALCHAYMQAGLLTSYELNDFGRHLPAFLAADAVLDDLDLGPWSRAFLAELAALLWAELSCYFAAPTPGADWPAQLNPTLQVRECQFAVARWLKAWRRDDMDACRALAAPQPETVLVWRRPSDALVVTEAADSMLLLAIKLSWQPELIPAALAEVAHRDLWQAAQARAQQCGLWLAPGARCTGIESVPVLNAGGGNQDALVARAAATVRPAPGCSTSMSPHPV